MFATLAGGYPWPPDVPAEVALDAVVAAQVEAGLGLISDGRVHPAGAPADYLVAAWVAARDASGRLAAGLPVKLAVGGPFAAAGADGALATARALNRALCALADAGLAALHARGLVHRDVTPRNILLAGAAARLGDLGLARPEAVATPSGGGLTPAGSAVGTLGYLAPEILDGRPATPAADVYGLAAVAYRALSGTLPRPAGSIAELVAAHGRPLRPLAETAPTVPAPVAQAIERALDVDPARRPTAVELARSFATPRSSPADERTTLDAGQAAASAIAPIGDHAPTSSGRPRRGRVPRPLPGPSSTYRGPGLWSGEAVAVVVIAIVVVLVFVFLGGRPG